jgi:hypothetical protein
VKFERLEKVGVGREQGRRCRAAQIQSDMGQSLAEMSQISGSVQKLYQTTMWPLAAINQTLGFVSNSITSFQGR